MTRGQGQKLGGSADSTPKSAGDGQDARASGASHISGAVSQAKSAASSLLRAVNAIQTDLEGQVMILEAKNYGLRVAAEHLQKQLREAKKNCHDPDSPDAMAGDVLAPPRIAMER